MNAVQEPMTAGAMLEAFREANPEIIEDVITVKFVRISGEWFFLNGGSA